MEQHSYDPKNQDYYFRLYHSDKLDFGWRVGEIKMHGPPPPPPTEEREWRWEVYYRHYSEHST